MSSLSATATMGAASRSSTPTSRMDIRSPPEKYALKLAWFRRLRAYFENALHPNQPAIWVGDLNIAPEPIDVYHPEKRMTPDIHIDARNAYKEAVGGDSSMSFANFTLMSFSTPTGISFATPSILRAELRLAHRPYNGDRSHGRALPDGRGRYDPRKAAGASDHTVVWAEFD
jgi:hypothetical protein